MFKRRNVRPAERRQYVAGLVIAVGAFVGLAAEIAWMMTATAF